MSIALSLVTVVTPDYDAGIAFFVGKLGFRLDSDEPQGDGKRWVIVAPPGGGARLLIAKAANERQATAIGNQAGGRVAFFLETDDFDRDHARFAAAGVRFLEAPRRELYGVVAVFEDPFGGKWDLIQPAS